jgi:hypothetical protein
MSFDNVWHLYQSGALLPAAIVLVYLLCRWGVGSVPWLKQPQHAHYMTAIVTALAVLAVPAAQGQSPTLQLVVSAVGTLIALLLPGIAAAQPVAAKPATPNQGGFVRLDLVRGLVAIQAMALIAIVGCGWFTPAKEEAGVHAAVACGVWDVARYAGQVESDLAKADFSAALGKLKADNNLTQDALNCVIQTVLAVFEAQTLPAAAHGELSPIVINGHAYLASHGAK